MSIERDLYRKTCQKQTLFQFMSFTIYLKLFPILKNFNHFIERNNNNK